MISRRSFLIAGAGLGLAPAARVAAAKKKLSIGVTDWDLRQAGKIEALALASSIGFDGVEVSLGRRPDADKLPLDDAELQAKYLSEAKRLRLRLAGTCLDILHTNYLKNDKLGQKWVAAGIPITKKLDARVMLLPFFGKGALQTDQEKEYVADVLKELAPEAEKARVTLGLENTISAEDNARILDRVKSKAVKVYYDIGNSTYTGHFDILKEIRWLGRNRICQIHLKDRNSYLGEGQIDMPAVIKAIFDIGFEGFLNLETPSPSKNIESDMKRNLAYVRKLVAETARV